MSVARDICDFGGYSVDADEVNDVFEGVAANAEAGGLVEPEAAGPVSGLRGEISFVVEEEKKEGEGDDAGAAAAGVLPEPETRSLTFSI